MAYVTRFSTAKVVHSTSLKEVVEAFELCWLTHFWAPVSVHVDAAFNKGEFKHFVESLDINIRTVPPQRHAKNPLESKHGVIRSIYLKLKHAAGMDSDASVCAYQAIRISNELYGNECMSAFELAKGFTKPVVPLHSVTPVPEKVINAQEKLIAKRKLVTILKSRSVTEPSLAEGDLIDIFIKRNKEKRGRWLPHKKILSINNSAKTVCVPGKKGHTISVAFEDLRPSLIESELADTVQKGIDELDALIEDLSIRTDASTTTHPSGTESAESTTEQKNEHNDEFFIESANIEPSLGDRVPVYWQLDDQFYPGVVESVEEDGRMNIMYEDKDKECLDMAQGTWRFEDPVPASSSNITTSLKATSIEKDVLSSMLKHFGCKPFLIHQAQGFDQFAIINAYKTEEDVFLKTVKVVTRDQVPHGANIIHSHTLFKIKQNDDGTLKLKARIAPHGIEDNMKSSLNKECTTCSPTGLRIVESLAALLGWTLYKADFTAAFLQTGEAQRDVYVIPPRESDMKATHLWLLLAATYGLVNANAKWQNKSDTVMLDLRMVQSKFIPQLFFKKEGGRLVLVVAKLVDDLKAAGEGLRAQRFLEDFDKRFTLGTINNGPGKLRFFGINVIQRDDLTIETDADDKLQALAEYPITRKRRKQTDHALNEIKKWFFASTNSSLGWIGTSASPFCSFYSSYLQQKAPAMKVCHLVEQITVLRKMKRLGTSIAYTRPTDTTGLDLSIVVFADASRTDDIGQLGILTGLLVGELKNNAIYHRLSWLSHKAKRPVKSIPAAEILAAAEGIDEGKLISQAYAELLGTEVKMRLCVDSKYLFTTLSTQRNSVDRSIRTLVNCIRFEFETGSVDEISWIPGKTNLADPLTKKDSALTETLQLSLFTGRLCLDFQSVIETKSSEKNFG